MPYEFVIQIGRYIAHECDSDPDHGLCFQGGQCTQKLHWTAEREKIESIDGRSIDPTGGENELK